MSDNPFLEPDDADPDALEKYKAYSALQDKIVVPPKKTPAKSGDLAKAATHDFASARHLIEIVCPCMHHLPSLW